MILRCLTSHIKMAEENKNYHLFYYYPWRYMTGIFLIIIFTFGSFFFIQEVKLTENEILDLGFTLLLVILFFILIIQFMVQKCQLSIGQRGLTILPGKTVSTSEKTLDIQWADIVFYQMIFQKGQRILKLKTENKGVLMIYLKQENYAEIWQSLKTLIPEKEKI